MYEGYSNAVYEMLPSGAVIVDRIHVAKNYRGCADKARIQEMQALKKTLSDNANAELKGVMWLFRKSWTTLIEGQQVTLLSLFSYSPRFRASLYSQRSIDPTKSGSLLYRP
jgi:transposase